MKTVREKLPRDFEALYESMANADSWLLDSECKNTAHPNACYVAKSLIQPQCNLKFFNGPSRIGDESQRPPRRRVLVPISGGIASLACAWWALNQTLVDVHFCYLAGVRDDIQNEERAVLCVSQLLMYARNEDGLPVFEDSQLLKTPSDPLAQQKQHLIVLPMPHERFVRKNLKGNDGSRGSKWHPLTLALMYRQLLNAAQATGCTQIVWGLFGVERRMIDSLHMLFSESVHLHQNIFPFENRISALKAFSEAAISSDRAYGDQILPVVMRPKESSESEGLSKKKKTKSGAEDADLCFIFQTAGPSLMPDIGQYYCKCQAQSKNAVAEEKKSDAEINCENNSNESSESAHAYLQRRALPNGRENFFLKGWCGKCVHCLPWVACMPEFNSNVLYTDKKLKKKAAVNDLLSAYEDLLRSAVPNVIKASEAFVAKKTSKKRNAPPGAANRAAKIAKGAKGKCADESDGEEDLEDDFNELACADFTGNEDEENEEFGNGEKDDENIDEDADDKNDLNANGSEDAEDGVGDADPTLDDQENAGEEIANDAENADADEEEDEEDEDVDDEELDDQFDEGSMSGGSGDDSMVCS